MKIQKIVDRARQYVNQGMSKEAAYTRAKQELKNENMQATQTSMFTETKIKEIKDQLIKK